MGRLIEALDVRAMPGQLILEVGDILLCHAFGGRITKVPVSGADLPVKILGPLVAAVVGKDGQVVAPQGLPNSLMLLAQSVGRASVRLNVGEPCGHSEEVTVNVTVEDR